MLQVLYFKRPAGLSPEAQLTRFVPDSGMSKATPGIKSTRTAAPLLPNSSEKDQKSLKVSTAKKQGIPQPAPQTATRAKQTSTPKDGTDGSIVLRPTKSGAQ